MFFKKEHIVKIQNIKYKDVYKVFKFSNFNDLKSFLIENYKIQNYKVELNLNYKLLNIVQIIEIFNLNPYFVNIDLDKTLISDVKEFIKKFPLNDYEVEYNIYIDNEKDSEEPYQIFIKEQENYIKYVFKNFKDFQENLKKLIETNIEHLYFVEPAIISLENYLKILNFYGKFENKGFKNSFELNQYIKDIRKLDSIVFKSKNIEEIT
jgi:hypothetical protein